MDLKIVLTSQSINAITSVYVFMERYVDNMHLATDLVTSQVLPILVKVTSWTYPTCTGINI